MMELSELYQDEDAASPVVGVILVVGIVIILAAGIGGTLVSTLDTSEPAPTANYEDTQGEKHLIATGGYEGDFPVVTIKHDSGEQLNASRLAITVDGKRAWDVYPSTNCDSGVSKCHRTIDPFDDLETFSTGDSVTFAVTDQSNLSNNTGFTMDSNTGSEKIVPDGVSISADASIQLEEGDSVRLVWLSEDRESSQTLYQTEVNTGV